MIIPKECLSTSESEVEAARVADDMVLTWKKIGFSGWEIENKGCAYSETKDSYYQRIKMH